MGARECQPGCAQGISALSHYVAMRYAQPLLSLGDSVHSIHLSTEFEAEIKFCDLVEAVNNYATLHARVDELTKALENLRRDIGQRLPDRLNAKQHLIEQIERALAPPLEDRK